MLVASLQGNRNRKQKQKKEKIEELWWQCGKGWLRACRATRSKAAGGRDSHLWHIASQPSLLLPGDDERERVKVWKSERVKEQQRGKTHTASLTPPIPWWKKENKLTLFPSRVVNTCTTKCERVKKRKSGRGARLTYMWHIVYLTPPFSFALWQWWTRQFVILGNILETLRVVSMQYIQLIGVLITVQRGETLF